MKRSQSLLLATGLAILPLGVWAQPPARPAVAPPARASDQRIGVIAVPSAAQAKTAALAWLKEQHPDAAMLERAEAIWQADAQPVLERAVQTLALGSPAAAKLLAELRDEKAPRPTEMPALIKDAKPGFFRANLALAAARLLVDRRLYEEALVTLRSIQPEAVVDPAAYYFYRAVCENRLVLKDDGLGSIHRLLVSVTAAPERYKTVASLMQDEMEKWEDQDLAYVARRMQEIESRLDNGRGGPKTQEKQKEVIDLLDKMIEDLQNQCQQCQAGAGGASQRSAQPAPESKIMQTAGPGNVDNKKFVKDAKGWGQMPEKEKIKAMEALSRGYPPHFKEAIEGYTKKVAGGDKPGDKP
jgi:hypothetical protein